MLLPSLLILFVGLIISVESRGPHHPRGEPVIRRHHLHYKPNPDDKEKLTQDSALLHDKQHIEEHLEDMVESPDLSKMSDEELEFYYFQTHDTDKNNKLDGLEILQAITHILDETDVSGNINNDSDFDYYIRLIDQVLTEDDVDNDGFLDYPEYVRSRQRSSKTIKKKEEEPPLVEIIP
ncbi:multiple coagulation factor deficiency protein 2 homolog [Harmonia axyridis]|uniref:multiple coagulation factor deficiency protein 2 homolog n=1 Tax=Harmonia axyridis TaxID=115357 RepID=UPI001E27818A|nr:multiple coagulation factor deficiency protein 2 homolog [Harmonia axyridis]XP_045480000.1 multiple coagulation factor deficiency protein 2 homolog [Harmonia axyridis]